MTDEQRFLAKVEKTDGCWLWQASRNRDGYGHFGIDGTVVLSHRWSYEHFVGPIPAGLNVLHRCDEPRCVNPAHLYCGTQADNVRDAVERGRWGNRRGPFHKLTPEVHAEIVRLYAIGDVSQSALARRFNVSQPTISQILRSSPGYEPLTSPAERGRRRARLAS